MKRHLAIATAVMLAAGSLLAAAPCDQYVAAIGKMYG